MEFEVGDQAIVGRDGVDALVLPQIPNIHRIVIAACGYVVTGEREGEKEGEREGGKEGGRQAGREVQRKEWAA